MNKCKSFIIIVFALIAFKHAYGNASGINEAEKIGFYDVVEFFDSYKPESFYSIYTLRDGRELKITIKLKEKEFEEWNNKIVSKFSDYSSQDGDEYKFGHYSFGFLESLSDEIEEYLEENESKFLHNIRVNVYDENSELIKRIDIPENDLENKLLEEIDEKWLMVSTDEEIQQTITLPRDASRVECEFLSDFDIQKIDEYERELFLKEYGHWSPGFFAPGLSGKREFGMYFFSNNEKIKSLAGLQVGFPSSMQPSLSDVFIDRFYGIACTLGNTGIGNAYGITIGGLWNVIENDSYGITIGGLWNGFQDAYGITIGGLGNAIEYAYWITIGGFVNGIDHDSYGITIGGLWNKGADNPHKEVLGDAHGITLAGGFNYFYNAHGLTIAGVANVIDKSASGIMISGVANYVVGDFYGMQVGLVNYVKGDLVGMQIGLVNILKSSEIFPTMPLFRLAF
ncbi:MAG: hypothetical protein J6V41_04620 [Kiritimatiellae bacterium]|nr:hypothetical protein [Kiritimatiellia bacterium]